MEEFPVFDAEGLGTIDIDETKKLLSTWNIEVEREKLQEIISAAEREATRDQMMNFKEFQRIAFQTILSLKELKPKEQEETSTAVKVESDSGEENNDHLEVGV